MRTNVLKIVLFAAAVLAVGATRPASAAEKEIVSYRLTRWKTLHFEDRELASKHVEAIKRLGCELKQADHGGHTDVSYYCPQWKQGSVATHAMAEEWMKWLRSAGFETKHAH
jgi:hypothetical protein